MEHWVEVKKFLKFLKRTKSICLVFGGGELKLEGFTDSDFMSNINDRKSTLGYLFTCNRGHIIWKSSNQATTTNSTMEAEYIAASEASKEGVWIRKFVTKLGVVPTSKKSTLLFCDNNNAAFLWFQGLIKNPSILNSDIK